MWMPRSVFPLVLLLGLALVGTAAWFVLVSEPAPLPGDGDGAPATADDSARNTAPSPDDQLRAPEGDAADPDDFEDDMRDLDRDPEGPEGGAATEEILAALDAALGGNPLKWREVERLLRAGGSADPAVTDRILELMENERFRRWAVDFAGHLKDPAALERFLDLAREADDPWTRAVALEAAARQVVRGDELSGRGALEVRQAAEALMREAAAGSPLSNGAAAALAALDDPESTRVLVEMLRRTREDPSGTQPLAEALGRVRDPESLAMLTRLATDEGADGPMRLAVIEALGRTGDPEVATRLRDAVRVTEDAAVKRRLYEALATIGDAPSIEAVVNAAIGERDADRIAASNALGSVKNRAARPILEKALEQSIDTGTRVKVIRSLGAIGEADSVPVIQREAADDDANPGVRREALRALGTIGDPRGADVALAILREGPDDAGLRREASGTLAKTATTDHYDAVRKEWERTRRNTAEYYILGKKVRDLQKELGIEDDAR